MKSLQCYLSILDRIPDEFILEMASRGIDPGLPTECIAGWAWRAEFQRLGKRKMDLQVDSTWDSTDFDGSTLASHLSQTFGGDWEDWRSLFYDIAGTTREANRVERAFAIRLDRAANIKENVNVRRERIKTRT
jgi:hypothetical protein